MAKRSKQAKKKRKTEHAHKKKLAQERHEQREHALARDLGALADRSVLDDEEKFMELVQDVLWRSHEWRNEPQFRNLTIDPNEAGRAMNAVWPEFSESGVGIENISDEAADEASFDLYVEAVAHVLTPAFKKDFLQRLERFRRQYRKGRDGEYLAQTTLMYMALRDIVPEEDEDIWPHCMLIHTIFVEALQEYEHLVDVAENAFEAVKDSLDDLSLEEFFDQPEEHPAYASLHAQLKSTPGMMDFLRTSTDEMIDEALDALFDGEIRLDLFTPEEMEQFKQGVAQALEASGFSPHDEFSSEGGDKTEGLGKAVSHAVASFLQELDTPDRREDLYATAHQRCTKLTRPQDLTATHAAAINVILDDKLPLAENPVFVRALIGQLRSMALDTIEGEKRSNWRSRMTGFARRILQC